MIEPLDQFLHGLRVSRTQTLAPYLPPEPEPEPEGVSESEPPLEAPEASWVTPAWLTLAHQTIPRVPPLPPVEWRETLPPDVKRRSRPKAPKKRPEGRLQSSHVKPRMLKGWRVFERDPCAYCGKPMDHLDHIDPIARGGENHLFNLTAACGDCNFDKGQTPLLLWLARRAQRRRP